MQPQMFIVTLNMNVLKIFMPRNYILKTDKLSQNFLNKLCMKVFFIIMWSKDITDAIFRIEDMHDQREN